MDTKTNDARVLEEFKKRKTRQIAATFVLVATVIPLFVLEYTGRAELLGIPFSVFVGIIASSAAFIMVFSLKNWRCPACGRYLGKGVNITYCKSCGTKLKEEI